VTRLNKERKSMPFIFITVTSMQVLHPPLGSQSQQVGWDLMSEHYFPHLRDRSQPLDKQPDGGNAMDMLALEKELQLEPFQETAPDFQTQL